MGYVYLICDQEKDSYKIGVTRNITQNRLKKLQTGNSTELHICYIYETPYPFRLETMLHNKFANNKELNEWFKLDANIVCKFKDICDQQMSIINMMKNNPFFSKNLK